MMKRKLGHLPKLVNVICLHVKLNIWVITYLKIHPWMTFKINCLSWICLSVTHCEGDSGLSRIRAASKDSKWKSDKRVNWLLYWEALDNRETANYRRPRCSYQVASVSLLLVVCIHYATHVSVLPKCGMKVGQVRQHLIQICCWPTGFKVGLVGQGHWRSSGSNWRWNKASPFRT